MFGGFDFERLFLVEVSEVCIWLMPEQGIVVEIDFCIESIKLAVLGKQEGIDLEQRRIKIDISAVERQHESCGFTNDLVGEADSKRELAGLKREQSTAGINSLLENLGRIGRGYFLDFHAACR